MTRKFRLLAALAAISALLAATIFLALGPFGRNDGIPAPSGERLPSFELPVLGRAGETLGSVDFTGRVTVLNAWASWCVPCRVEHPSMLEIGRMPGVSLFGLNHLDADADALRWLAFYGDPYDASLADRDGAVGRRLGLTGVPETWVMDPSGRVRYRHSGTLTEAQWRDVLEPLLRRLAAERP